MLLFGLLLYFLYQFLGLSYIIVRRDRNYVPKYYHVAKQPTFVSSKGVHTSTMAEQPVEYTKPRAQFCKQCGSSLDADSKFCSECGLKI